MRIAWYSPLLETAELKSAAFTSRLVNHLPDNWDVEFFIDDLEWQTLRRQTSGEFVDSFDWNGHAVFHFLQAFRRNRAKRFDAHIFHVEDSPRCAFVQQSLRLFPGICYFHDLNLRRLECSRLEHGTTGDLLNERISADFGDEAIKVGDWEARGWSSEVLDSTYPLGEDDREQAAVAVVENVRSVEEFLSKHSNVELSAFPVNIPSEAEIRTMRVRARGERDLDDETCVVGFLGRYLFDERIYVILEAFRELLNTSKSVELLWLVVNEEERLRALDTIERVFGVGLAELDFIRLERHATQAELEGAILAADVMLGLRFDVLRGISLSTIAALSFGIPTVVTEFGPGGEIPSPAVMHLPVGRGERETLVRILKRLLNDSALRRELGRAGRNYVETVHGPEAVMTDLRSVLARHAVYVGRRGDERENSLQKNRQALIDSLYDSNKRRNDGVNLSLGVDLLANAKRDFAWGV